MIELRFRRDLYAGEAVDAATKVYAAFADVAREESPEAWVVRVTVAGSLDERHVADELANYALGATIERSTA